MNKPLIRVAFSFDFKRDIKRLRKKYPHIREDVDPLIKDLERGETPGDRLKDADYVTYKVRVKNTDAGKGKRGGYRVVCIISVWQTI